MLSLSEHEDRKQKWKITEVLSFVLNGMATNSSRFLRWNLFIHRLFFFMHFKIAQIFIISLLSTCLY